MILIFVFSVSVLSAQSFKSLDEIGLIMAAEKEAKSRYSQKIINEIQEIWVYETPKGEVGYQVVERDKKNNLITSTGYGSEWESRSFSTKMHDEL